jgi:hypothetical protein
LVGAARQLYAVRAPNAAFLIQLGRRYEASAGQGGAPVAHSYRSRRGKVVRFLVGNSVLWLVALGLCSCSSPSIPPWAAATLKSQYRSQMQIAETSHVRRMHIARPTAGADKVEGAEVANHKPYDEVASVGNVPVKFQYLKPFSEEWRQRQEREAQRMRAATSICRC